MRNLLVPTDVGVQPRLVSHNTQQVNCMSHNTTETTHKSVSDSTSYDDKLLFPYRALHSKSYRTCRVTTSALRCESSMVASSLHAVRNKGFQKCRLLNPDTSLASPPHRFDSGTWTRLREGQSPIRTRQLYLALA